MKCSAPFKTTDGAKDQKDNLTIQTEFVAAAIAFK